MRGFLSSYFSFKFSFLCETVFVWTYASKGPQSFLWMTHVTWRNDGMIVEKGKPMYSDDVS
jgi:hypothetical protein